MIITIALRVLLLIALSLVFYQDTKERAVWWFLFPLLGLFGGYLHFTQSLTWLFFSGIFLNFLFVIGLFAVAFFYAKIKMKVDFLKEAIGLGDILFYLSLAVAFPTEAFLVILVFSMVFSLGLHVAVFRKNVNETVPLAGYASLFLMFVYLSSWSGLYKTLYFIG